MTTFDDDVLLLLRSNPDIGVRLVMWVRVDFLLGIW